MPRCRRPSAFRYERCNPDRPCRVKSPHGKLCMNRPWLIVPALLCGARIADAESLQTVYDHALAADPTMQQADAVHRASRETRTQAILDMLPLNAVASKNWYGVASQTQSTP